MALLGPRSASSLGVLVSLMGLMEREASAALCSIGDSLGNGKETLGKIDEMIFR